MSEIFVYVGSWMVQGQSPKGIAIYSYDEKSGRLSHRNNVFEELRVGFAYLDKKRRVLFVADEREDHPEMRRGGGGQILALSVQPETGDLIEIGRVPSYGVNPTYIEMSHDRGFLLVTNHGSRNGTVTLTETDDCGKIGIRVLHDESSVVVFRLADDGSIAEPCDIFRLEGEGPAVFQLGPHAHSVVRSPLAELYAVCDKGGDLIHMLSFNAEHVKLVPGAGSPTKRSPGSAPRYAVFHPEKPYLFVNSEYKAALCAFRYNVTGALEFICEESSLPAHIAPPDGAVQSDICIGKTGRYLYTLLRIVNVISVHEIDTKTGGLTLIQTLEGVDDGCRGCAISPDGRFLVVAAFSGNTVTVYPIGEDGRLSQQVFSIEQPQAATVTFYAAE